MTIRSHFDTDIVLKRVTTKYTLDFNKIFLRVTSTQIDMEREEWVLYAHQKFCGKVPH